MRTGRLQRNADLVIEPKLKEFPERYDLVLDHGEHTALEDLYDLFPKLDDELALIHQAIRKGIGVLAREAEDRDPHEPKRSQLRTRASDTSQALGDAPPRRIFQFVSTPVPEWLGRRLEKILDAHPDLDEETAWERLLELGAERVEEVPDLLTRSPAMKKARAMVRHAEGCLARAKRAVEG